MNPVGIELFAGCGGLSTGFLDAGLRVAAGFEIDRRAVEAYDYNHAYRSSRGFIADLSSAKGADLLSLAGIDRADFVIGGPPCQPFSVVGKRQGADDPRANLINHFVRIVKELSPSVFLLENVPNLAAIDGGIILNKTKTALAQLGYAVDHRIISAADYGVPQNRRRLIILGLKEKHEVCFPGATHGILGIPFRTASNAIGDLPDAGEFGETGIYNHEPTVHCADILDRFSRLEPGRREKGSFHDRLHPDRPSYTLRAGSGNFSPLRPIHYKYHRVVTARESARLQGFSDNFIWPDSIPRLQQYRQIGNAVPPPMAEIIARSLAHQMNWQLNPAALVGDPAKRLPANRLTDEQRRALRSSRMRGASLGRVALAAE